MKTIQFKNISEVNKASDCLVIVAPIKQFKPSNFSYLDKNNVALISNAIDSEEIKADGAPVLIHTANSSHQRLLVQAVNDNADYAKLSKAFAAIAGVLKKSFITSVTLDLSHAPDTDSASAAFIAAKVITEASYQYQTTLSDKKKQPLDHIKRCVIVDGDDKKAPSIRKAIKQGQAYAEGVNFARQLGNLPANICTPTHIGKEAKKIAKQDKFSCKVLSEKNMRELGMNSFLSVSAGSDEPAQLIHMQYNGAAKSQKPIVLVGKGITFDTGGISLKPGAGMDEMKFDMCGAASVMGVFKALTILQPKRNIVGIVAASENMPNGKATKPGDVVKSMSGKTIEILNTDAEGRLVLCDSLTYAQKQHKPAVLIDLATLTGACVVALGSHAAGLYSNNEALGEALTTSGNAMHDRVWPMPLWEDYNRQLRSNFADLANIGGREAGSVTAACFLQNFVNKDVPWAHLDIAGIAWKRGAAKGASGRPVSMLLNFIENFKAP